MERELVELTSRLVAIDSVNPDLVPGGAGEAEAADFVAGWAKSEGLATKVLEGPPGRPGGVRHEGGRGGRAGGVPRGGTGRAFGDRGGRGGGGRGAREPGGPG